MFDLNRFRSIREIDIMDLSVKAGEIKRILPDALCIGLQYNEKLIFNWSKKIDKIPIAFTTWTPRLVNAITTQ